MNAVLETTTNNYEIERGKPMPSKNHAIIQGNLIVSLGAYRRTYRIMPELKLNLEPKSVVPDICIYPSLEFNPMNDESAMTEMPLCTIEIISSSQTLEEMLAKAKRYFDVGIGSYWLVLPPLRTIYVFHSMDEFKTFNFTQNLIDKKLEIELDLGEVFS